MTPKKAKKKTLKRTKKKVSKAAGKLVQKKTSGAFSLSKRWHPALAADGFTPISTYFLENYHRLKPYDLTHGEAMFVIHLMQYKWNEQAPFPAYKTIAERMHVSEKTARRYAVSLDKKGYLRREFRIGNTNLFHLRGLIDALVEHKKAQKNPSKRASYQNRTS